MDHIPSLRYSSHTPFSLQPSFPADPFRFLFLLVTFFFGLICIYYSWLWLGFIHLSLEQGQITSGSSTEKWQLISRIQSLPLPSQGEGPLRALLSAWCSLMGCLSLAALSSWMQCTSHPKPALHSTPFHVVCLTFYDVPTLCGDETHGQLSAECWEGVYSLHSLVRRQHYIQVAKHGNCSDWVREQHYEYKFYIVSI